MSTATREAAARPQTTESDVQETVEQVTSTPETTEPTAPATEEKSSETTAPAEATTTTEPVKVEIELPMGNSAYADPNTRIKLRNAMKDLEVKGFTRPEITKHTGLSDSQVWRAHNYKVHATEVPTYMDFIAKVVAGDITPPPPRRKPRPEDLQAKIDGLQAKIDEAVAKLADTSKMPVKELRALVDETRELLNA